MGANEKSGRGPRLSVVVAGQLEAWISEQGLKAGAQLPTEKVLCERFGVSRAVIREAISRLKADGCVMTRQGSGAYVAARPGQGSFRLLRGGVNGDAVTESSLSDREISDIFELRYLVEAGAAELAALRCSPQELDRMRDALERMAVALETGADAHTDDDAFHVAIAAATHNPQIERFQAFMGQQFSDSRAPTWNEAGHRAGRARDSQAEHVRIFEAIAAGDPNAARAAATEHLAGAVRRFGLDARRWGELVAIKGKRAADARNEALHEVEKGR
ncbi:FadR/GntR family transcriptional regulator [Aromatoleum evansii]|uniref:FadR/GntR family transcriptional regulator n=1 Tax=Aromatoleum evansii TaxID=59406 RepID=A0ABZ1AJJ1_AROEV|nr:FadR/GntR family transcriptional regulator [Aromatoleum evansii]NMG30316.1 FCD domain-containing protein [Aromatoleum evansii]WRL45186.1 FadR/GntR family transcriptional regulator [Aromatoleum evansii]